MITGELKNKIDQLWEMLWTEGNANPLTNIEQLTYLLFMKDLDSVELGRESDAEFLGIPYEGIFPKDKPEYRWSTFKNIGDAQEVYRLMTQEIFPFIKNLKGDTALHPNNGTREKPSYATSFLYSTGDWSFNFC